LKYFHDKDSLSLNIHNLLEIFDQHDFCQVLFGNHSKL